jgi:hypothetical protein
MYRSGQRNVRAARAESADDRRQRIIDERIRTIEQIKRLYAVIMGFAITQIIANQYGVIQSPGYDWRSELSYLVAQGVCFATLITLFYLGAERMLEARYLRDDSPVPTRLGLLADLVTLAIQGFLFVILANTVPDFHQLPPDHLADWRVNLERVNQLEFVRALIVLNILDSFSLALALARISRGRDLDADAKAKAMFAHWVWLILNLAMVFILLIARQWPTQGFDITGVTINILALALFVTHVTRFWLDYANTFHFYYPPDPLQEGGA